MDRGYQHNLTEKLPSEINKTQRNWKSSLLKQNSKKEKKVLPFATQCQPLVSTIKEKVEPPYKINHYFAVLLIKRTTYYFLQKRKIIAKSRGFSIDFLSFSAQPG